jgi:hypothetical protein
MGKQIGKPTEILDDQKKIAVREILTFGVDTFHKIVKIYGEKQKGTFFKVYQDKDSRDCALGFIDEHGFLEILSLFKHSDFDVIFEDEKDGKRIILFMAKNREGKFNYYVVIEDAFYLLPWGGFSGHLLNPELIVFDLQKVWFFDRTIAGIKQKPIDLPGSIAGIKQISAVKGEQQVLVIYKEREGGYTYSVIIDYLTGEEICRTKL